MRGLRRLGVGALVLLLAMFASSLLLWIGVPLGWLWVASQIQGATGSVGPAIGAAMIGVILSIALMMVVLSRLSGAYRRTRVSRGLDDTGSFALESVMALSAILAVVGFSAWFFLFAGASPIPFNPGE